MAELAARRDVGASSFFYAQRRNVNPLLTLGLHPYMSENEQFKPFGVCSVEKHLITLCVKKEKKRKNKK